MGSKSNKHSKAQSKFSDQSLLTPPPHSEVSADELQCTLDEASSKYPSLIGKSALIGRVANVQPNSRGCKIWLSEPSMVTLSIVPGSTVSVSLASSRKKFPTEFPLSSLADECARRFGADLGDRMANKVGNYFVLATVYPSCKVLKDEVRLSLNLSRTMGIPASGRIIFVHPIQIRPLNSLAKENDKLRTTIVDNLSLSNCKDLYLELIPSNAGLMVNNNTISSPINTLSNTNDDTQSPKTPLYNQTKLSSPSTNQLTSRVFEKSVSSFLNLSETMSDVFDIGETLWDESSRNLIQTCAASWLYSCSLLYGNLVAIPILSKICLFCVSGASKLSPNQDLAYHDLCPQTPDSANCAEVEGFVVNRETKIQFCLTTKPVLETPPTRVLTRTDFVFKNVKANKVEERVSKLGGLSKEYSLLKDIIISSSVKNTLSSLGLRPTKGVLLHGPPGTGKTSLARLCVEDAGINLFNINGSEIVSQYYGESEKRLHEVFDSAYKAAPAVVFIDELDAIAPTRKDGGEELSQRMVATLLNLMDGISRTDGLLVIAATNRPDSIEPALRRPGRLDREIEIAVPSPKQRLEILLTLLREMKHTLSDINIQHLAMTTHGFVGADLEALCNEAALVCLRRYVKYNSSYNGLNSNSTSIPHNSCPDWMVGVHDCLEETGDLFSTDHSDSASSSISANGPIGVDVIGANGMSVVGKQCMLKVDLEDFERGRVKVRPSAMREVILEVPKVKWEDIGGQKEVKAQLMEAVEWPQKHQDAFKRIGTRPPTGVLLFGPPGCSKTLMARAVASEAGLNFLAVKGPELFSKWVGESEKAVRSLFAKARANAPSIVFFDEIDGLAVIRGKDNDGVSVSDRVMSQLLVELDGLHQRVDVTVIAATNRPDKIDSALLRPGRFDRLLYVGPPNGKDREDIFHINLRNTPCSSDVSTRELASLTEGCTGADISLICREAAVAAVEESTDASEVRAEHFKTAISRVQPSEIQSYELLSAKFQRLVHSRVTQDELECRYNPSRAKWNPFSWSKYFLFFA